MVSVFILQLYVNAILRLGASLVAQMVKNLSAMQKTWVHSLSREDPPGGGNVSPLQYACLENTIDRGAWQATVQRRRIGQD